MLVERKVIGAVAAAGVAVLATGAVALWPGQANGAGQAADAIRQSPVAGAPTSASPTSPATAPDTSSPSAVTTSARTVRSSASSRDLSPARTTSAQRTAAKSVARHTTTRATRTTKPRPSTTTRSTSTSGSSTYESQLLSLVNAERTSRGLPALRAASCPDRFAESWAAELARTGAFSHQSLGPIMSSCGASQAAENIARGSITPAAMVKLWMGSAGHRANILDPQLTQVGTAAVRSSSGSWTAVQDFIRP